MLQLIWFSTILRVAHRVITGRGAEDARSDDEEYVYSHSYPSQNVYSVDLPPVRRMKIMTTRRKTSDQLDGLFVPHSAGYTCGLLPLRLYSPFVHNIPEYCTWTLKPRGGPWKARRRCTVPDFAGRVTSVTQSHHPPAAILPKGIPVCSLSPSTLISPSAAGGTRVPTHSLNLLFSTVLCAIRRKIDNRRLTKR